MLNNNLHSVIFFVTVFIFSQNPEAWCQTQQIGQMSTEPHESAVAVPRLLSKENAINPDKWERVFKIINELKKILHKEKTIDWEEYFRLRSIEVPVLVLSHYEDFVLGSMGHDRAFQDLIHQALRESARFLSKRKDGATQDFIAKQMIKLVTLLNHPDPNFVRWSYEYQILLSYGASGIPVLMNYIEEFSSVKTHINPRKYALRLLGEISRRLDPQSMHHKALKKKASAFLENVIKSTNAHSEWEKKEAQYALQLIETSRK